MIMVALRMEKKHRMKPVIVGEDAHLVAQLDTVASRYRAHTGSAIQVVNVKNACVFSPGAGYCFIVDELDDILEKSLMFVEP